MSRSRTLVLALLLIALVAYSAAAPRFSALRDGLDVAFLGAVALPAFVLTIWLALPLARTGIRALVIAAALSAALAVGFGVVGVESGANVAKLAAYALAGFAFLELFEELWWIALVAVLVPWVDVWSVAAGPTEYVIDEQPGFFDRISVTIPGPGDKSVNIGPPDVLFFALFLAAAQRFGLRVGWTWAGMTACLSGTLVLVWAWDGVPGLPALPAVCLGFLLPNADLLLRNAKQAWARPGS